MRLVLVKHDTLNIAHFYELLIKFVSHSIFGILQLEKNSEQKKMRHVDQKL